MPALPFMIPTVQLETKVNAGDAEAMHAVALSLMYTVGDKDRALELFQKAAEFGYVDA